METSELGRKTVVDCSPSKTGREARKLIGDSRSAHCCLLTREFPRVVITFLKWVACRLATEDRSFYIVDGSEPSCGVEVISKCVPKRRRIGLNFGFPTQQLDLESCKEFKGGLQQLR
ncbi:uncharacterized protein J3R85_014829 [Psidium guajava]|nr:uncharacterized protein J3R85_014829 [Psidium guajava]